MPPVEKPNYTQIPNAILDNMASMTMPEYIVISAICRQTFGWHKKSEKLSTTQLQALTGLSKHAVLDALDAALRDGWITRKPAGQTYRYTVNVLERTGAADAPLPPIVVQETHRYPKRTGAADAPVSSAANAPVPVQQTRRYTPVLKKDKETNYKESKARAENAEIAHAQFTPAPAVSIWQEVFDRTANKQQAQAITDCVTDCGLWREVLTTWALKGHSSSNIADQLDVYANGWQRKPSNGHKPQPSMEVDARSYITLPILKEHAS